MLRISIARFLIDSVRRNVAEAFGALGVANETILKAIANLLNFPDKYDQ
jgi:hypothetical protein